MSCPNCGAPWTYTQHEADPSRIKSFEIIAIATPSLPSPAVTSVGTRGGAYEQHPVPGHAAWLIVLSI
jgi:hypothetical protein